MAHSKNEKGETHSLIKHLTEVALSMENNCYKPIFKKLFRITGLLHDFGKYQPAFQKYLEEGGRKGSVPHASWGAVYCKKLKQQEAAFVIDGHHKGLPDLAELQADISALKDKEKELEGLLNQYLSDIKMKENELVFNDIGLKAPDRELFIRFLFSSLTDADWLDTERHFNRTIAESRVIKKLDIDYLIEKIEIEIEKKDKSGELNRLRNNVRRYAISKSAGRIGFYSMTLPTGMGKTLASVSWALHHAKNNGLRRIIIVLPFISIIDQTAGELKRIFGDNWVLEHHSSFTENETLDKEITSEIMHNKEYGKRLATENWDYPIIITTSVQFFESLFSNKPSKCRKLHNIAQTVVIFDEVQTLPKELVIPTLTLLKDIHRVMNTSFLFCTATQPAFEKREGFDGIDTIEPLVENPKLIFEKTKRVNYIAINNYQPVSYNLLSTLVNKQNDSCLCIFNTKVKALAFFKRISSVTSYRLFHLSTRMYPVHRKRIIAEIRSAIERQGKIIVASTQLIEAGVDFDFPCVFRETAPLESIIQSAGRCNRNNSLPQMGKVFLFKLEDSGAPDKQYRSLAAFANDLYKNNEHLLHEHNFFINYYQKALHLFYDEDRHKINESRKEYNFRTVAESYRLIDDKTTPVFILCDESRAVYESVRYKPVLSRDDFRKMQLYSVQVYDNFLKNNIEKLGKEPQGYWMWHGKYDKQTGISEELENLIF